MQYKQLSVEEREMIQLGLWQKESIRAIALSLNRSPSSVSREIKRNSPPDKKYYIPRAAHQRALVNRKNRGRHLHLKNPDIRSYVIFHLKRGWSPEQIAGRLSMDYQGYSISHEAIYQYIYSMIRPSDGLARVTSEDLRVYLKRRHRQRVKKGGRRAWRIMKPHGPSIDDRPAIVATRTRIGDWEGDLMISRKSKAVLQSLVDRKSGLLLLTKAKRGTAAEMRRAANQSLSTLPAIFRRTLTLDNGSENTCWNDLEKDLGLACFFAHPYHSWERGTNENTNGLVRWYLPKGTDLSKVPDIIIQAIQKAINHRPRKRLGWKTPVEVFNEGVALTG